jgi:hypothetical protein
MCQQPSPVPTEIIDLSPEDVRGMGIIVWDFAYKENHGLQPIPETFDPNFTLGKYDYLLLEVPRTRPIPGKTLQQLLDIGWVKEHESLKWASMDQEVLATCDKWSPYPWHLQKALKFPTEEEQKIILQNYASYFHKYGH